MMPRWHWQRTACVCASLLLLTGPVPSDADDCNLDDGDISRLLSRTSDLLRQVRKKKWGQAVVCDEGLAWHATPLSVSGASPFTMPVAWPTGNTAAMFTETCQRCPAPL